ncbi:hypothetical protein Vretifemale_17440 [Volvox reticuliferus]|uniref:Uncharacterized protein n=1 Tax=Volvox reticuliferus TaxID=1737510 RepID=A0A8J4CTQ9_9CHLO|nr:hypothetical protein Vretifemale_17440 [Volvox reticuliferus]
MDREIAKGECSTCKADVIHAAPWRGYHVGGACTLTFLVRVLGWVFLKQPLGMSDGGIISLFQADILQHAAAREATAAAAGPGPSSSSGNVRAGGDVDREEGPGEAEKADLMARLRAICQDLGGNRREQMRQDVFKPSHILPTMTVEEAGEIERREAMEREEQQRWQEEKERQRRVRRLIREGKGRTNGGTCVG